jgi:hypothetical protein
MKSLVFVMLTDLFSGTSPLADTKRSQQHAYQAFK